MQNSWRMKQAAEKGVSARTVAYFKTCMDKAWPALFPNPTLDRFLSSSPSSQKNKELLCISPASHFF